MSYSKTHNDHHQGSLKRRRSRTDQVDSSSPWQAMKRLRVNEQLQQSVGQDTMSEGFSPVPETMSPMMMMQQTPDQQNAEGVDHEYQNVNHVLGALHMARQQREQKRLQLEAVKKHHSFHAMGNHHQGEAVEEEHPHRHNQERTMFQPLDPQPPSRPARSSSFYNREQQVVGMEVRTPLGKPKRIVRLNTNSKLG